MLLSGEPRWSARKRSVGVKLIRSLKFFKTLPILLALAPVALRAQASCSLGNATMSGAYVFSGTGSFGGAPVALVGKITYDGQGKATAIYSSSVSGTIYSGLTATATYTVNGDCTGSTTITDSTGTTSHYDFVILPDGSRITWIETDTFTAVVVTAIRFDH